MTPKAAFETAGGKRVDAVKDSPGEPLYASPPADDEPSYDERMEAKYAQFTREQLRSEVIDSFGQLRGELLSAEVERYVASGMAERVPEEDAFISGRSLPGVQPALHLDTSTGDYYKVLLTEEDSPQFFEIDREWRWLCKRVYGHEDIMLGKMMGGDE